MTVSKYIKSQIRRMNPETSIWSWQSKISSHEEYLNYSLVNVMSESELNELIKINEIFKKFHEIDKDFENVGYRKEYL